MKASSFQLVGAHHAESFSDDVRPCRRRRIRASTALAGLLFALIVTACLFSDELARHDPDIFHLGFVDHAPDAEFWFGTDSLGRDIYSIIWRGCRASLTVGLLSTAVIAVLGLGYGCASGMASDVADAAMMRVVELCQSVPRLLSQILLLSLMGTPDILELSLVIGVTGWFALARMVRGEVRQIRGSDYLLAARCMGASFFRILRRHLIPNVMSAVLFMIVSSVSTGMIMEATLSFIGLGLPVDVVSLGSMLALADKALLLNTWWVIVFPGIFLMVILLCLTVLGQAFRRIRERGPSNL